MFVKVRCTFCVMCVTILIYTNSLLLKYFYVVILLISNARSSTKTSILNSLGNQQTNILILFVFKMLNTSLLNFMIIFRKRGKSKVKWIHFSVLLKNQFNEFCFIVQPWPLRYTFPKVLHHRNAYAFGPTCKREGCQYE